MPRHKDTEWNLPEGAPSPDGGRSHQWSSIHSALLMDIRDEMKENNRLLRNALAWDGSVLRELRGLRRDLKKKLERRCHGKHVR